MGATSKILLTASVLRKGGHLVDIPMNDVSRRLRRHPSIAAAVARVIKSGRFLHGPEQEAFEAELATYLGRRFCVGVASGTDALELAIRVADRSRGGPVVTAANAGGYTTSACRRVGVPMRFADVSHETQCLTPETVQPIIAGASVLVVTHLYGRVADAAALKTLCEAHGVALVEDCAQALGGGPPAARAGSFGDLAAVSFYPTKNLGALGDGGAVLTSSPEHDATLRSLRQYGWSEKYVVALTGGVNSRLGEIQAAVLRAQLPLLDAMNDRRRQIIRNYRGAVSRPERIDLLEANEPDHAGHLAVALVTCRDQIRAQLADQGVATDIHYPVPDHRQPAFTADYGHFDLPVTERSAAEVLSLPCFPELTDQEVQHVCRALSQL